MESVNSILFSLMRSAILGVSFDEKDACKAELIPELYRLSNKHDMAHIVGYSLIQSGLIDENNETYHRFHKKQLQAIYRYEKSEYELSCIRELLEREGIPFIILKGPIVRKYYVEQWMRTSCDIDVLIHKHDIERAVERFEKHLGYTASDKRNYHDISLYSPSGVHLELHFSLKENMDNIDAYLQRVWEFSAPISDGSMEWVQSKEYFMFHLLAHTAYHFVHGGCGIKPFMDLYILDKSLGYNKEETRSYCRACGIEVFMDSAEALAEVWFGGAAHSPLTLHLENYVLNGGAYGDKENNIAIESQKSGGKLRYIIRRIFMSTDMMKVQFPVLEKHPCLLPFCHVCRWSRLIFKGRLKRSVNELKITADMDKDTSANIAELMNKVGL